MRWGVYLNRGDSLWFKTALVQSGEYVYRHGGGILDGRVASGLTRRRRRSSSVGECLQRRVTILNSTLHPVAVGKTRMNSAHAMCFRVLPTKGPCPAPRTSSGAVFCLPLSSTSEELSVICDIRPLPVRDIYVSTYRVSLTVGRYPELRG